MNIVENKKFYHIQTIDEWNIGETHFIGKEKNPFNGYFDKNGHNYFDKKSGQFFNTSIIADHMVHYINTSEKDPSLEPYFQYDKDETINHLRNTLGHYLRFSRESIFEEVRANFFPNMPSRLRCLWVIPDDKDAVKYWWNTLGKQGRILELSISGKIHQASQQYLSLSTNSFDLLRQDAFKYWTSATGRNKMEDECLFEGFAKVESIRSIAEFE